VQPPRHTGMVKSRSLCNPARALLVFERLDSHLEALGHPPHRRAARGRSVILTRVHLTPASSGVIARDSRAFGMTSPRRSRHPPGIAVSTRVRAGSSSWTHTACAS